jgi:hypothetical protein
MKSTKKIKNKLESTKPMPSLTAPLGNVGGFYGPGMPIKQQTTNYGKKGK